MKEIALTQGKVATVDDEDFLELTKRKWYAIRVKSTGNYYAATMLTKAENGGKRSVLRMHCAIFGHKGVDHKDSNGLNNQRSNLRPCTQLENTRNRGKPKTNTTSKFKGVYARGSKFRAQIMVNYKKTMLGTFDTEIEAARAYDQAAKVSFGDFASLNFPDVLAEKS